MPRRIFRALVRLLPEEFRAGYARDIKSTFDAELDAVRRGGSKFKAVRGEYGSGKTFVARWLQERARRGGFAAGRIADAARLGGGYG